MKHWRHKIQVQVRVSGLLEHLLVELEVMASPVDRISRPAFRKLSDVTRPYIHHSRTSDPRFTKVWFKLMTDR